MEERDLNRTFEATVSWLPDCYALEGFEGRCVLNIINHSSLNELIYQIVSWEQKGYLFEKIIKKSSDILEIWGQQRAVPPMGWNRELGDTVTKDRPGDIFGFPPVPPLCPSVESIPGGDHGTKIPT